MLNLIQGALQELMGQQQNMMNIEFELLIKHLFIAKQ